MMILLNTIVGFILSPYEVFNWVVNDIVIIVNTCFLIYLAVSDIEHGFKLGLGFLVIVLFLLQYVSGLFIESVFNDNWLLIIMLVCIFIQFGLVLIAKSLSRYSR